MKLVGIEQIVSNLYISPFFSVKLLQFGDRVSRYVAGGRWYVFRRTSRGVLKLVTAVMKKEK